jgi:hypothetical protein
VETFTKLFGSLLIFVYHCFDRVGSSRQGCESSRVKVPTPSIACIRTVSISGAC